MSGFPKTAGLLLGIAIFAAACESQRTTQSGSPFIPQTSGTMEEQFRQQQLRNARQNSGMQNPVATGRDVSGIVRDQSTTGSGNVTAGAPVAVNPGTTGVVRQGGVGAPSR